MSGGYNPKVAHPYMSNNIPQMRSEEFQPAFFFGGSQVPNDLMLKPNTFSGSGLHNYLDGQKIKTSRKKLLMPGLLRR
jgi:hypothetical protein